MTKQPSDQVTKTDWYALADTETTDSPTLLIYPERAKENIRILKTFLPDTNRLRPHVKTHKSGDMAKIQIAAGITKFKCATIAEAEMLAIAGASDVLLAYQPIGPKASRLKLLSEKYTNTHFSCLVDNFDVSTHLSEVFSGSSNPFTVFIDLNVGMNRTGVVPSKAEHLYSQLKSLSGIKVIGIHAYDGHHRDADFALRTKKVNETFLTVDALAKEIEKKYSTKLTIVTGGSYSFPIHAKRENVEVSPGTFIYWDIGAAETMKEQPYLFAALVMTRIISKPTNDTLCIDLGHKSIASENPIDQRVFFLNAPELKPIGHSEEHLILQASPDNKWKVGDVLYGVPFHICPTCALYDTANIVEDHKVVDKWNILSRNRSITV